MTLTERLAATLESKLHQNTKLDAEIDALQTLLASISPEMEGILVQALQEHTTAVAETLVAADVLPVEATASVVEAVSAEMVGDSETLEVTPLPDSENAFVPDPVPTEPVPGDPYAPLDAFLPDAPKAGDTVEVPPVEDAPEEVGRSDFQDLIEDV